MREQILSLFESGGTPDEIAEALGCDPALVVAVLKSDSALYRATHGEEKAEDVSDGELKMLVGVVKSLALSSANEFVQLSAAKYLIQEKKGRNDPKAPVVNIGNLNVTMLNERMKRLRAERELTSAEPAAAEAPILDI